MKAAEGRVTEQPHFEKNEPSGTNSTVIALEATDAPRQLVLILYQGTLLKAATRKITSATFYPEFR